MEIRQGFPLYNKENIKGKYSFEDAAKPRIATPFCFVDEIILFFYHRFTGRSFYIFTNKFLFYNRRIQ